MTRVFLLSSAAFLLPSPALAQEAAPPAEAVTTEEAQPVAPAGEEMAEEEDGEEIVVTGQRPRGSVIGDIPPENVLNPRDIRSTGATSISELLDAVATQTGSARGRGGGRPILLLNGQRISGFRELRDLPPEAIARMEVLPEEVALKYGYSADQRVVNIVLRRRFDSTTIELGGRTATDGGYSAGRVDAGKLLIREGTRTSLNLRLEGNTPLTESERDIALRDGEGADSRPFQTLVGTERTARLTGTHNRTILGDVSATVTGEAEHRTGRSLQGLADGFDDEPLRRRNVTDSAGLGFALNGQRGRWRLSGTGNADLTRRRFESDPGSDNGRSTRRSLEADATATGPLFELPAGDATATFRIGASTVDLNSRSRRGLLETESDLGRDIGEASANLDLPLLRGHETLGRLTANANGGVRRLSDFGTLTSLGAGANWAPSSRLNFIASWTREEGAPSLEQLGDPLLETGNVPFFDAVRGETVSVTTLSGGNPDLDADRRNVFKIGGNWRPLAEADLRLRAEFVHQTIASPQIGFPAVTEALEAAFPERFTRDADGTLLRVDLRPVNADRSVRDTVRWGFDFTKPLRSQRPSPQQRAAMRERFGRGDQAGRGGAAPPAEEGARAGQGRGRGGGFGGRFGGAGGGRGGRLTLSATHTLTLTDQLEIGPGVPELDYLEGEALGATGGRPRHQVEVESGYYNNGIGARLSADWRSGTRVGSASGAEDLRFSPYGTFNLRLFANLGERFDLVSKAPFFRGSSVRFEVNNLFNARPKVRGGDRDIPFAFQADRLEPIGRTVGITFRKLFLPSRFSQRRRPQQR